MTAEQAHNLSVQAFSLRRSPVLSGGSFLGAESYPLADEGFPVATTYPIDGDCPADSTSQRGLWELAVQLARTSNGTGTARSFTVTYDSDGERRALQIPFTVTLCAPDDSVTPRCQAQHG